LSYGAHVRGVRYSESPPVARACRCLLRQLAAGGTAWGTSWWTAVPGIGRCSGGTPGHERQVFPLRGIAGVGGVHHAALHGAISPDPGHHDPRQLIVSPAPGATPSSTGLRPAPEPSTPAWPPATPQTSGPSLPPATAPCWAARPAATPGRYPDRPSRTPATRCPGRGAQRPVRISPVTGQQPPGPRSKAGTAPTAEQGDLHDLTSASNPAPGCPDSAICSTSFSERPVCLSRCVRAGGGLQRVGVRCVAAARAAPAPLRRRFDVVAVFARL
jgi:hypothetical protein